MNSNKIHVACEVFTEKMDEALRLHPDYKDGMAFPYHEDGLVLCAPMLNESQRMALHKAIFDEVSKIYTITRS